VRYSGKLKEKQKEFTLAIPSSQSCNLSCLSLVDKTKEQQGRSICSSFVIFLIQYNFRLKKLQDIERRIKERALDTPDSESDGQVDESLKGFFSHPYFVSTHRLFPSQTFFLCNPSGLELEQVNFSVNMLFSI